MCIEAEQLLKDFSSCQETRHVDGQAVWIISKRRVARQDCSIAALVSGADFHRNKFCNAAAIGCRFDDSGIVVCIK